MRTGVGERMCKKTDNKRNERSERPIIKYIYVELVLGLGDEPSFGLGIFLVYDMNDG